MLDELQIPAQSRNSQEIANVLRLWQAVGMKNKNKRELEKHWAEQAKKSAKKPAEKKRTRPGEDFSQAAARIVKEATDNK
jgi:hypothetical protein